MGPQHANRIHTLLDDVDLGAQVCRFFAPGRVVKEICACEKKLPKLLVRVECDMF